jgi:hypothetical protein
MVGGRAEGSRQLQQHVNNRVDTRSAVPIPPNREAQFRPVPLQLRGQMGGVRWHGGLDDAAKRSARHSVPFKRQRDDVCKSFVSWPPVSARDAGNRTPPKGL